MFEEIPDILYLSECPAKVIISPTTKGFPEATSKVVLPTAIELSEIVVAPPSENAFALAQTDTFKLLPKLPTHLAVKCPALLANHYGSLTHSNE